VGFFYGEKMNLSHIRSALTEFFSTTIWELEPEAFRGVRRHGLRNLQILTLVIKDFRTDQCQLRASALTFTTLLSIVPLFALMFAVLKGFGVHNRVEPFILNRVAAGSQETVDLIVTYIDKTNMTSLGAIGLVTLVLTVISVLGNIEEAFNVIWGVKETRSFYRKFSDYMSVVVTGPLLLLATISITTTLQSQSFVRWMVEKTYLSGFIIFLFKLVPYVTIWLALVFLYIFIPNTRVKFKSALVGGVIAGTVWQLAQWGYIHFQVGVAKYNAIYGTLAALPVFIIWIYVSWLIVLFGVELVYAHQNIHTFIWEVRYETCSQSRRELLTLGILERIGWSFHFGQKPRSAQKLAEELRAPVSLVSESLGFLMGKGYIIANAGDNSTYTPACELEDIKVKEVIAALRNYGDKDESQGGNRRSERMQRVLDLMDDGTNKALAEMSLKDLVLSSPGNSRSTGAVVDK
jgi:membrane protein